MVTPIHPTKGGDQMPSVYVPSKSSHDYSNAQQWGDLVFMSEGPINRFNTNHMCRMFWHHLKHSNSEDFVLQTGLRVMSDLACALFSHLHGGLNILIYDETSNSYRPRRMVFPKSDKQKGETR